MRGNRREFPGIADCAYGQGDFMALLLAIFSSLIDYRQCDRV